MSEPQSIQDLVQRAFESWQQLPPEMREEQYPPHEDRAHRERQHRIDDAALRIPARYRTAETDMVLGDHGLYLWGGVGTGKTHTAAALALQAINKGLIVRWVTGSAWLAAIRASFSGAVAPETPQELASCHLLVIDDLGAEKPSEWAVEQLLMLVNLVYERDALVIVTSNLRLRDLNKRLGQRITSRLIELCDPVELTGADRRIAIAHARQTEGNGHA